MVQVTGDSGEAVTMELLERVAEAEDWSQGAGRNGPWRKSREEILTTFRQCRAAVRGEGWPPPTNP